MEKLNFFTPIEYSSNRTFSQFLRENVDHYFYCPSDPDPGKKAKVLQGLTKNKQEKIIFTHSARELSFSARLADTVKVISYVTVIIPLIMLTAKALLRATYRFKVIDPQSKLEKGMHINEEIKAKLQHLLPKIAKREEDPEVEWLSKGNNLVFKLTASPQLVFKLPSPNHLRLQYISGLPPSCAERERKYVLGSLNDRRFANMIAAKKVCLIHQLGLLKIPRAKKIEIENYPLIVEEALDFNPSEKMQETLYHKYSRQLNETVRQLATFIAKTGFNDVAPRNIPLLNDFQEQAPRRIALIDLEHMRNSETGFVGDKRNGSWGLIECLPPEQIDTVIREAVKHFPHLAGSLQKAKTRTLEAAEQLRQFYERKGIINGKEPFSVDLQTLGLDLEEERERRFYPDQNQPERFELKKIKFGAWADGVLKHLACRLQENSDELSIKGKRFTAIRLFIPEEEDWMRRLLQALKDRDHIFNFKVQRNTYFIQA